MGVFFKEETDFQIEVAPPANIGKANSSSHSWMHMLLVLKGSETSYHLVMSIKNEFLYFISWDSLINAAAISSNSDYFRVMIKDDSKHLEVVAVDVSQISLKDIVNS